MHKKPGMKIITILPISFNRFQLGKSSLLSDGLTGNADSMNMSPMNTIEGSNDKNALLPSSAFTKSSTSEESSDSGADLGRGRTSMSAMLPPEYVDIQDEIDSTMNEINSKSK